MIASQVPSLKYLQIENLRELAGCSGFCLTALVPPLVPGEKTRYSPSALLRSYVHDAEARLTELSATKEQIAMLLDPLAKFASNLTLAEGFHWSRAILRSPEIFEEFLLRRPVAGAMTVARHFQLLALVAETELPREFYLLKLTKKRVSLARATSRLEPVALPKTAETLDQFLALDFPDHDRENRNVAGGSAGSERRIRFGSGSDRENQPGHLADFYKYIDHAMSSYLRPRDAVLVLVGVEDDTALFRSVCTYPRVIEEAIHRSPDDGGSDDELIERAVSLIRDSGFRRNAAALGDARERLAPARFSEDPEAILKSAAAGRVAQLYVAEDARDDKLNRALIETLTHAGEVHALAAGSAPAATLRY